jgi:hypothetical protein
MAAISGQNEERILRKCLIMGPLIGVVLGFLIPFLITGELPFRETNDTLLGNMTGLKLVIYLYCIGGGAILGLIVGAIMGAIVGSRK